MPDNLTPNDRRKTMQAVKGKKTRLERVVFSMLAGMRLKGWVQNANEISGKPDVVFFKQKVAIFIDGCFWHGCPYCRRKLPQTNRKYWKNKISRNAELALLHHAQLQNEGWEVIRIWEHELHNPEERQSIRNKIRHIVNSGAGEK
jgi:DNA mismatch endonuclease (patch repair protein)